MRARIVIILCWLFYLTCAFGQTDNTLYVRQFPGQTVAAKLTAAIAACNPDTAIPCILVLDPSLAKFASGSLPSLCSQCFLVDYRNGAGSQSGRGSLKVWKRTFGTFDQAATASINAGSDTEPSTEIMGIDNPAQLSTYANRDSAALFVSNIAPAPLVEVNTTTFTATSVTSPAFGAITSLLKVGMIVDVWSSPRLSGFVTGWSGNTIYVGAFYIVDGSQNTGTPVNGTMTTVDAHTAIWALDTLCQVPVSADRTYSATCEETDLGADDPATAPYLTGKMVVNVSANKLGAAYKTSGAFGIGYHGRTGLDVAFESDDPGVSAFRATVGGNTRFDVDSSGLIDGAYFTFANNTFSSATIANGTTFQVNSYSGATLTMPAASTVGKGKMITVLAYAPLTLVRPSQASLTLPANAYITQISDGTNWNWVASGFNSPSNTIGAPALGGVATLVSGTVTVSNAGACTPSANCVYKLTNCGKNSSTAIGSLSVGTVSAGTSFVINSLTSAAAVATADASTVCWQIN